jgi:DNA-binding CsgD family transcriptional regulator
MTTGRVAGVLLERDDDLSLVGEVLERARDGTGGVVVLAGPLGNGKTALLRALSRHPGTHGFDVLHASATLIERDHAYGVIRQLLGPVVAGAPPERWTGPAALAGPLFERGGGDLGDAEQSVHLGLLSLGRDLSTATPLFVLVDDLQWADDRSLVVLAALARRIRHLRAVLLVAVREGDPLADRPAAAAILAAATHRVRPRPLSPAGATRLVRARLGRDCDGAFGTACHEATGGNPMLLTALALAWAVDGREPVAANADAVRAMRPAQARERLGACMRAQPEPVRRLLTAAAVLAEHAEADVVSALAGLDGSSAAEVLRGLRKLGLFAGDGFAHPSARDAADDLMTADERERLHLRAVRLLHDLGKPVEAVAGQLLAMTVPQGAWAVEALRDAAHVALRRGAPQRAVAYLRRALLDTSIDGQDRAAVLVDLASAERLFDVHAAVRTISYAVALLPGPRAQAAAMMRLTPAVMSDAPDAVVSILRQVVADFGPPERLSGVDRDLALRLEARLRFINRTEAAELAGTCARLEELGAAGRTDSGAERELASVLVHAAALGAAAPARRVAALAEQLLAREPASSAHSAGAAPLLVTALAAADAPAAVAGWLDRALDAARRRGDAVEQATIRTAQSLVDLMSGRVADATRAASEAFDLGACARSSAGTSAVVVSGTVALQLGDPALVDRMLTAVEAQQSNPFLATVTGLLRGYAAVLSGEFPRAAVLFTDCGARLDRAGWRNPVLFPWRSSLALVKHKLGDTSGAIGLAEEERLIAEEWGAASGVGRTLRVLGRVVGGDRGRALTARSVEVLEGSAHRLELVHALRQWAEMNESTEAWRNCLRLAEEIGAQRVALRARTALGGGVPVATGGKLTRSERKVAMLAMSGRSNQEIAALLEVTSRAVEKHLTNTYRKLGVRRRSELAAALESASPTR